MFVNRAFVMFLNRAFAMFVNRAFVMFVNRAFVMFYLLKKAKHLYTFYETMGTLGNVVYLIFKHAKSFGQTSSILTSPPHQKEVFILKMKKCAF